MLIISIGMIRSWNVRSLFRRRRAGPKDLQADVLACSRALGRKLPPLGRRYSMQALTIALAMHLRTMLRLGLQEGQLTEQQVAQLVRSLLSGDEEMQK